MTPWPQTLETIQTPPNHSPRSLSDTAVLHALSLEDVSWLEAPGGQVRGLRGAPRRATRLVAARAPLLLPAAAPPCA